MLKPNIHTAKLAHVSNFNTMNLMFNVKISKQIREFSNYDNINHEIYADHVSLKSHSHFDCDKSPCNFISINTNTRHMIKHQRRQEVRHTVITIFCMELLSLYHDECSLSLRFFFRFFRRSHFSCRFLVLKLYIYKKMGKYPGEWFRDAV